MLNVVTVNCGLNQSFSVCENTIIDLVSQTIVDIKNVKLDRQPKVIINESASNIELTIDLKIKNKANIKDIFNTVFEELNNRFSSLLDIKPQNIKLCFCGFY
ncbi:MMB_0454 family protein [Mycoplasmopsis opalescens]|uniref:MMB_0454 family protein n=1 Tax=Mycoplasmopsis opalescens TaxID=114886 RepID=UPI0004A70249|nr:hypothetical protein [Mycoplasmopsis opalescens]